MHNLANNYLWGRRIVAITVFSAVLIFLGASALRADEASCQRRLIKADHQLHHAARDHGWQSKQAEHARHEIREAREYCYTHEHKWWDEDGHRWHSDRDWDDHDHDRDHR